MPRPARGSSPLNASIAPISSYGTSKTRPGRPASPTRLLPTSSAALTGPTNAATTWPKNSTAPCSTGSNPAALPNAQAPLNSESPGLIVDRLSILSLKIYHTREEADREYAPDGHAARNRNRLTILESHAPARPDASTTFGTKPSTVPANSRFTASSRCTTTPR